MNTETQKQFETFAEERRKSCTTISPINMKEMIEKVNIKLGYPKRKGIGRRNITKKELVELYVQLAWKLQTKQTKLEEKEQKEMKTATKKATAKKATAKKATAKKATVKKATAKKATAKKATAKKATAKKATAKKATATPRKSSDTSAVVKLTKKVPTKKEDALELLGMRESGWFHVCWEALKVLNKLGKKATIKELRANMPKEPKTYPKGWCLATRVLEDMKARGVITF